MAAETEQDPDAPGWDAITQSLEKVYGDQQPLHWGPILNYRIGGQDPLDGISAYRNEGPPPHWHLVTYGFSELYDKESDLPDQSGWGFELTFRLARTADEQQPPAWALNFLQNLARYVFSSGNPLAPGHHMDINGPIAIGQPTQIKAILLSKDPQLPQLDTPYGRLEFVQIVGITLDELDAAQAWRTDGMLELLAKRDPLLVTDLARRSILDDEKIASTVRERGRREGSNTAVLYISQLDWEPLPTTAERIKITVGAKSVSTLKGLLPNRLLHDHELILAGPNRQAQLKVGLKPSWSSSAEQLEVQVPREAVEPLADALRPERGVYATSLLPGVTIEVVPTSIKDPDGKVAEVIG